MDVAAANRKLPLRHLRDDLEGEHSFLDPSAVTRCGSSGR